jgi:hypothetical protein
MNTILRRLMDLLHAGGLPLVVVLLFGAISLALAAVRSRAAYAMVGATAACAVAAAILNGYAARVLRETEPPSLGPGAMVSLLLPDPWSPLLSGVAMVALCLVLLRIRRRV